MILRCWTGKNSMYTDTMKIVVAFFLLQLVAGSSASRGVQSRQTTNATIPEFVKTYAPLVYLDENEQYLPSDIQAQLNNTIPELNFTAASGVPNPLVLANLNSLNSIGSCTNFTSCDVYLTSKENVTTNPSWLYGVLPDTYTGETVGAKSTAVIVNDHGNGVVDAFYMFFYAFNYGLQVLGGVQGNHVGDWEHTMIRFVDSEPNTMFFSAHDGGAVYKWSALEKNGSRPIVYSAIGSHANFANTGTHTRMAASIPLNDYTSKGPLWNPIAGSSAYYYTYIPHSANTTSPTTADGSPLPVDGLANGNGTFIGIDGAPTAWLYFLGAWGDKQYLDSDPCQDNLGNLNISWRWESGPTGPLDKVLNRTGTCPNVNCTTLTEVPTASGSSIPVTITRTTTSASVSSTSSSGGVASTTASIAAAGMTRAVETGVVFLGAGLLAVML